MRFSRLFQSVCVVLGLTALAGCGNRTNLAPVKSDQPMANTQLLTDIPIPNSATMDNERSIVLADRDHWVGRVVMRFWQNTSELTAFYQAQMPSFGWEPVMSVNSAISILTYIHGDHAATVQIEESTMGLKTQVSVTVAPRPGVPSANPGGYNSSGGTGYGVTGGISAEPLPPSSHR